MNWYEIRISTSSQAVEAVADMLYSLDISGVIIEDPADPYLYNANEGDWDYIDINEIKPKIDMPQVKGYVSYIEDFAKLRSYLEERMEQISQSGLDAGSYSIEIQKMEDTDWENEWKKYYKPFPVGNRLAVKPSWETLPTELEDRIVVEIDPGGAFGSGTHETTYTCMEALEKYMKSGDTVIDVGTGSGILSIVAAKLGAGKISAVDNSFAAYETTLENVRNAGYESIITPIHGNLVDEIDFKADVVVANIIADVIMIISEYIGDYMKEDAFFISSGIINIKKVQVLETLDRFGFEIVEMYEKGEWVTIVSRKRK